MWDGEVEVALDAFFAQNAVVGTGRGGGVGGGGNGVDAAAEAGFFYDGAGKVVPRGDAFVGVVVDAFLPGGDLGQDGDDGLRKISGKGGRADLIRYDVEGLSFRAEPPHGGDEVAAAGGVEPGGADDDGGGGFFQSGALAGSFGLPVDGEGGGGIARFVGAMPSAVEDVVGGDVDEGGAGGGEVAGRFAVEASGFFRFLFRPIDGGVGGAVDDVRDAPLVDEALHGVGVGDVECVPIRSNGVGEEPGEFSPQLPVTAGDEVCHGGSWRVCLCRR